MEGLDEVVARLPLAEAVLRLWRWVADEAFLSDVYESHRGRSYPRFASLLAQTYGFAPNFRSDQG